jgi:hypothetical protein
VDAGFLKLMSDSFCGNGVFKLNIQFCCHLCCSISAIFQNNPQCTAVSVIVDFCPLFLIADVVFPLFMYADITLEIVTVDTPNNVAVFVTDASAKCAPI